MELRCRHCGRSTKHWKAYVKVTVKRGGRQRYMCSKCGSTRYK